jgi:uroporphyrin-III C-methyltransferase
VVSLVGAGPGDPDLVTRRALQRLEAADVVFHDGLVPPAVLSLASSAELVSVARRAGPAKRLSQADVTRLLIRAASRGRRVVRLKSGDPFIFGRGGEELDALRRAGITAEVVPGVSSATAAASIAEIPLTYRDVSSAFVVVSGHDRRAFEPAL